MPDSSGDTFQIGLALAGAISAGAYTAGVLDFLFQALDEWDRQRGKPGVPDNRVALKVVAGASAGAITGALGAVALARGFQPVQCLCLRFFGSEAPQTAERDQLPRGPFVAVGQGRAAAEKSRGRDQGQ